MIGLVVVVGKQVGVPRYPSFVENNSSIEDSFQLSQFPCPPNGGLGGDGGSEAIL